MKGKKATVLTFAEKCKNILASNWQGHLNTIKADAKGSKEDIYTSKVKYILKRGKPYIWVPEKDLHNVNTIIDERGSFAVTSPFPGPLASLLRLAKKIPARVALTGDVEPLKDGKAQSAAESLRGVILSEQKAISKCSYTVSGVLSSSDLSCTSRSESLKELLEGDEKYVVYKFNLRLGTLETSLDPVVFDPISTFMVGCLQCLVKFDAAPALGLEYEQKVVHNPPHIKLHFQQYHAGSIAVVSSYLFSTVQSRLVVASSIIPLQLLSHFEPFSTLVRWLQYHLPLLQEQLASCPYASLSSMFIDGNGGTYEVDLEDIESSKADPLAPFSAKLIDGINQNEARRRALMLFCFEFLNANARDAYMLSIDRKGFDVLGKVPSPLLKDGSSQYQWKEFRFTLKEEASDVENFCHQLVEMEEESVKKISGYSGLK
uniref:Uncharacterized protein n=1 Tax=Quercus lobata TaxID=97700 RepID=A0A7N2MGT0_QUELO